MMKQVSIFFIMILLVLSIVQSAPQITITPNNPAPDESTITCAVNGRETGYLFSWFVNGHKVFVGNPLTEAVRNGLGITLNPGDTLLCRVQTAQGFFVGETSVSIANANQAPTVQIIAPSANSNVNPNSDVTFTAVAVDPENDPITYSWNFGDGSPAGADASTTHVYATEGAVTAAVTVTDSHGNQGTAAVTFTVTSNTAGLVINNLETFNDNTLTQPVDLFFRGNPLFVRFQVQDAQGNPVSGVTVSGTVDNPATAAQTVLELIGTAPAGTYTFQIQSGIISLDDTVLGADVQVNVQAAQGTSTVQAQSLIEIRNNPPVIDVLPVVNFPLNRVGVVPLWDLVADRETADADLRLSIADTQNIQVTINAQGDATFTAAQLGIFPMVLQVDDQDGGIAAQTFIVNVGDAAFAPVAILTVSPTDVFTNDPVTFDSSGSFDSDGQIVSWTLDFGDGQSADGITLQTGSHTYTSPGTFTIILTVTDNNGLTGTATKTVKVTERVIPAKDLFATGFKHNINIGSVQLMPLKQTYKAGEKVTFLIKVRNAGSTSELVQVKAFIQGSNSMMVTTQQINAGDNRLNADLTWVIPQGTKPGRYWVTVEAKTASGGVNKREFVSVVVA